MPSPVEARDASAWLQAQFTSWLYGRTFAATMTDPRGDRHGARRKIACLVSANDLPGAFCELNKVWDLTPEDVELTFCWRMPGSWSPNNGEGLGFGEDPCPPELAELGEDLSTRAPQLFVKV